MDHTHSRVSQVEEEEEEEEEFCCNMSKKAMTCGILVIVLVVGIAITLGVVFGVLKRRQLREWKGAGTTPHFREILLGRCYTYTQVRKPEMR